jgi:hypothetical protein
MDGAPKESWVELCKQAAEETDRDRLLELTKEIDKLLGERLNP